MKCRKQKQNCNVDKRNTKRRRRRRTEAGEKIVFFSVFPSEREEKRGRKRKTFFAAAVFFLFPVLCPLFFCVQGRGEGEGRKKGEKEEANPTGQQMEILIVPAKLFQFFCGQTMPANFDCS